MSNSREVEFKLSKSTERKLLWLSLFMSSIGDTSIHVEKDSGVYTIFVGREAVPNTYGGRCILRKHLGGFRASSTPLRYDIEPHYVGTVYALYHMVDVIRMDTGDSRPGIAQMRLGDEYTVSIYRVGDYRVVRVSEDDGAVILPNGQVVLVSSHSADNVRQQLREVEHLAVKEGYLLPAQLYYDLSVMMQNSEDSSIAIQVENYVIRCEGGDRPFRIYVEGEDDELLSEISDSWRLEFWRCCLYVMYEVVRCKEDGITLSLAGNPLEAYFELNHIDDFRRAGSTLRFLLQDIGRTDIIDELDKYILAEFIKERSV